MIIRRYALAAMAFAAFAASSAFGQLTIEVCHEKALAKHPLSRQYALYSETRALDLALARRGYLPRLTLSGKASYQSDVTSLASVAGSLPPAFATALSGATVSKDQYTAMAELTQSIWDGGVVRAQVEAIEDSSRIDARKLDVDLYALNDRVDQLFFGILAVQEQLKQNAVLEGELAANYGRVEASVENGVASRYDLNSVQVERLSAKQRKTELEAALRSGKESLGSLVGEELGDDAVFAMPEAALAERVDAGGARPELALFDAQGKACDSQEDMARASAMPKVSAFFQAAYGQPGLDMFQGGFSPYWIGGLRLTWSVNALVDLKDQIGKIESARESIEARRRAFILDNGIQAARAKADIGKLRELLASDDEIIALREGMRKSVEGKRDNGAATTDDVLKAIDAESLARQMKSLHEVQLAMAAYAYKYAVNE